MESFHLPKSLIDYSLTDNQITKPHRKAIITGITGQDGLYLTAFLLLDQNLPFTYEVHGIVRKNSANLPVLERLRKNSNIQDSLLQLHYGDVTDSLFMNNLVSQVKPDEIYNLAAQSQVQHSFSMPQNTSEVNFIGLMIICQSVLQHGLKDHTRIFQASTSEMYGQAIPKVDGLMDENFPFNPASPYAVSKIASYYLVKYYRNAYQMKISSGISFNHESPLRHTTFITRKITKAVARIKLGLQAELRIGNLYAKRDWGHAKDFVRAFWLINNQDQTKNYQIKDYVIATQQCITVKEFLFRAFQLAGIPNLQFTGTGINERLLSGTRVLVTIDPQFLRPGEVPHLIGNSSLLEQELKWKPSYTIETIISEMLEYDIELTKLEKVVMNESSHRPKL